MIPLRDVIPSRTPPVVTIVIIARNAAVFAYELWLGRGAERFVSTFGLVPAQFSPLALVTAMFVHVGFLHFGGNMLYLWIFGDNVEDRMGHARFAVFYLLCGCAAALMQMRLQPDAEVPLVGASGAIAGVLGAYFLLYPRSKIVTLLPIFFFVQLVEIPALLFLGVWVVMQLASGVGSIAAAAASGVAFWAHVTGFAAGAAGVLVFRRPERQRVEWWNDLP